MRGLFLNFERIAGGELGTRTEAYCDKLTEVAQPLFDEVDQMIASCHAAGRLAGAGWWTSVC